MLIFSMGSQLFWLGAITPPPPAILLSECAITLHLNVLRVALMKVVPGEGTFIHYKTIRYMLFGVNMA